MNLLQTVHERLCSPNHVQNGSSVHFHPERVRDPPIGSTAMEPARLCVCVNFLSVRTLCVGGTLLHFVCTGNLPGPAGTLRVPEAVSAVKVRIDRFFWSWEGEWGLHSSNCRHFVRVLGPL